MPNLKEEFRRLWEEFMLSNLALAYALRSGWRRLKAQAWIDRPLLAMLLVFALLYFVMFV